MAVLILLIPIIFILYVLFFLTVPEFWKGTEVFVVLFCLLLFFLLIIPYRDIYNIIYKSTDFIYKSNLIRTLRNNGKVDELVKLLRHWCSCGDTSYNKKIIKAIGEMRTIEAIDALIDLMLMDDFSYDEPQRELEFILSKVTNSSQDIGERIRNAFREKERREEENIRRKEEKKREEEERNREFYYCTSCNKELSYSEIGERDITEDYDDGWFTRVVGTEYFCKKCESRVELVTKNQLEQRARVNISEAQ